MFLESLLETAPATRARRGLTTATSFAVQTLGVATLIAVPLLFPDAIPVALTLAAPPEAPIAAPTPDAYMEIASTAEIFEGPLDTGALVAPREIPTAVNRDPMPATKRHHASAPPTVGVPWGVPAADGGGPANNVIASIVRASERPLAVKPVAVAPRHRISRGVSEGLLIHKLAPVYPRTAIAMRVEGEVVLHATISARGEIESLRVASGHPLLTAAAVDAVREWRYRPYMLGSEPVAVETQVIVRFKLRGE